VQLNKYGLSKTISHNLAGMLRSGYEFIAPEVELRVYCSAHVLKSQAVTRME